jgi:hypothetical protein
MLNRFLFYDEQVRFQNHELLYYYNRHMALLR